MKSTKNIKSRPLKIWNGRGHGKYDKYHIYVAAYTIKQACELIGNACELRRSISTRELNLYYAKNCWGNSMEGIIPTEPCIYVQKSYDWNDKPKRII